MSKLDIRNCDNMDLMREFPDKYFDLAIVDPPYGIGNWWKKSKHTQGSQYGDKKWNQSIPSLDYFQELFRVSKNQIIWGGNYFTEFLPPTNAWIIWDKLMSENQNVSDCELAWTSFKMSVKKITVRWSGACKDEADFNRIHPCQRPVKLHNNLLHDYGFPGCKILDTHLGSGSIAIACHDYGFDLTACELDKEYYEAAMKRINAHVAQQKLFV